MIDYALYAKIRHAVEVDRLTIPQAAASLGIDQRTVRRWIREKQFRQRLSVIRASKLDPFKADIIRMLESHPYTATQVFQKIREQGFAGRYSIVKRYVAKVRPKRSPAFLKLVFQPGEAAQVDWGSFGTVRVGSAMRRLSFFVMVLCHSRMMYLEFTTSQTMEHFLACHSNAFSFFGGIPKKVMVDNCKTAVLSHAVGQPAVLHPKYLDFAHHYGFTIAACGVRKANEKGRVENGVGYVKKNFLAGLEIPEFSALGPAAAIWLETVANVRIHGETKKLPVELLKEELASLQPLPAAVYDIATIREVRASSQFRVTVDANTYSVPARYAGKKLTMKLYPDRLCLYDQESLIVRHGRSYDHHQDFENPDHPKELLLQRKNARNQQTMVRFLALSPLANNYLDGLVSRRLNPNHHVAKIVALADLYGTDTVARALADAVTWQAFSSEYIINLCEQRSRLVQEPGPLMLTRGQDLLELTIEPPDLSVYEEKP